MDSLFPFLQGLAPLQHAGLARRTPNSRSLIREAAKNKLLALFTDTEGVVNANDSNLDVLLSNIS
jgi:hypothetical protein